MVAVRAVVGTVSDEATGSATGTEADHTDPRADARSSRTHGSSRRRWLMADVRRLPGPNADIWDWQRLGSCRGMDSAFFFHPDGERGPARAHRERRAKAVCRDCPVVEPCRRHAIAAGEPYGIWGGMSESERVAVAPGRPRRRTSG